MTAFVRWLGAFALGFFAGMLFIAWDDDEREPRWVELPKPTRP